MGTIVVILKFNIPKSTPICINMVAVENQVPVKESIVSKEDEISKAKETAKEVVAEAADVMNLLAQGKRNMMCGEMPEAVTQLQEACRLLAKKYGETADECGEAYLAYGTALLDLSRMESGVLGNALEGAHLDSADESADEKTKTEVVVEESEKITEEEREKISDQVIEAMTEERPAKDSDKDAKKKSPKKDSPKKDSSKKDSPKKDSPKKSSEKEAVVNGDKKEETEESMETENGEGEEGEEEEEGDGEEGEEVEAEDSGEAATDGKETKEDSEEDVTNLQLAWEVLELSKLIYNRQESKEMKLKGAEAHLKLGEVGMETEQYEQALGDLTACLKIQQELLEPESRLIAESHYQIGLACVFATKYCSDDCCGRTTYNLALLNFRKAVSVINSKMSKLHANIEEEEKKEKRDASIVLNIQKEISDLKDILPDILAKIEDTEDESKNTDKVKQMVKDNFAKAGSSEMETDIKFSEASSTEKGNDDSASDIGHLVRKKRKSDDDAEENEDSKKAKADVNGKDKTPLVNGNGSKDAKVSK